MIYLKCYIAVVFIAFLTGCVDERDKFSCYMISDNEAFELVRETLLAKSDRQRNAPTWRNIVFEDLEIIRNDPSKVNTARTVDMKTLYLGYGGKIRLTAFIYPDCYIGWGG